jgi:hypothetical protein
MEVDDKGNLKDRYDNVWRVRADDYKSPQNVTDTMRGVSDDHS